jgi:quaternary ammonium compound-resistance protein SugE
VEIGWAIGLKYMHGFTRLGPTAGTVVAMVASLVLRGLAIRSLPVGTAYAVWTGIGTVGRVLLGILLLGESSTPSRLAVHRHDRRRHRGAQAGRAVTGMRGSTDGTGAGFASLP